MLDRLLREQPQSPPQRDILRSTTQVVSSCQLSLILKKQKIKIKIQKNKKSQNSKDSPKKGNVVSFGNSWRCISRGRRRCLRAEAAVPPPLRLTAKCSEKSTRRRRYGAKRCRFDARVSWSLPQPVGVQRIRLTVLSVDKSNGRKYSSKVDGRKICDPSSVTETFPPRRFVVHAT